MSPKTFREFEHSGWQNAADSYHNYFSSLTSQTIGPLLDALNVSTETKLLDIACGPGYVAAEAAKRGASITGIDFSSVMIEMASKLYPNIHFLEGDAANLPFADNSFNAASMNFGLLHLDNPEQAVIEAHRVVHKNGRFAFTVWSQPAEALAFDIVLQAIEKHGNLKAPLPSGPAFFRFSNKTESERIFKEAGFSQIAIKSIPMIWQLPTQQAFFDAFFFGTARTGGLLLAQTAEDLKLIQSAIFEALTPHIVNGALEVPMAAIVVSGSK